MDVLCCAIVLLCFALATTLLPKILSDWQWVYPKIAPPRGFIARVMQLAMVRPA